MDSDPIAADIAEATDELFQANLALIESAFPRLHQMLVGLTAPHTQLVRVGEDDWDVEFRGNRFYDRGARDYAQTQVDLYKKSPNRMRMNELRTTALCHFSGEMAVAMNARIAELPSVETSPFPATDDGWHLIIYGWGLGEHVRSLLEFTHAHNLIIVEPNIEMILHSLRTLDWRKLFKDPPHRPLTIKWIFADYAEEGMAFDIRHTLRQANVCRIDGSYFFHHYPNSQLDMISRLVSEHLPQSFKGLGYIDDEVRMIRNSSQNHRKPDALIFKKAVVNRDWPVFVLGSGPSLDATLPIIKANADRAIIIACGTALPIVLKAGLKPDFMMILENGEVQYDWLSQAAANNDFGDTTLVASNTVDRRLSELFKKSVYFVRPGLASSPIFASSDESDVLNLAHPTVGNTGVAFALQSGFREMYMFGMDLGARDAERHHADNSPYNATGSNIKYTHKMNISRRGNFGGNCVTDHIMDWGRDTLEHTFAFLGKGRQIYNCSNGVYITGANPKVAKSVKLPVPRTPREKEIEAIMSAFTPYGEELFKAAWERAKVEAENTAIRDQLIALAVSNPDAPLRFIDSVNSYFSGKPITACYQVYRGTVQAALLGGAYFATRVLPQENQAAAAEIFAEEFRAMIGRMGDYVQDFLNGMKEHGHYEIPRL